MTEPPQVAVRRASQPDVPVLAALSELVQQLHHAALPEEFKAPDARANVAFFTARLTEPSVTALLAESGADPVGYALTEQVRREESDFTVPRATLYVQHIAVIPAARRQGVGRRLMAAVDEEARRRGLDEVALDYWSFNTGAQQFYASLGFRAVMTHARRGIPPARTGG